MTTDRINTTLKDNDKILSIFLTAGFPKLNSLMQNCIELQQAGVKMIEIGFPFSDPIADGETIQKSSEVAIKNGMNLGVLFNQLSEYRYKVSIPTLLMGYLNPVVQYGVDRFLDDAKRVGIDGLIIPDLPMYEFKNVWKEKLAERNISFVFLITPQTSEERIREIDEMSTSFIYAVSSQAVTGGENSVENKDNTKVTNFYKYLNDLNLKHPIIIGFGISDKSSFQQATEFAKGAIIGSAFIRAIDKGEKVSSFVSKILD